MSARLFGIVCTATIALSALSAWLFGWSMFSQSIRSFGSDAGYAAPNDLQRLILSSAIEEYGPFYRSTICAGPITESERWTRAIIERAIRGWNNPGYESREQEILLPDFSSYKQVSLRYIVEHSEADLGEVLVPKPWQTGQCDGWIDVYGPVIDADRAFIVISRSAGAPDLSPCWLEELMFAKDHKYQASGMVRPGWSIIHQRTQSCQPVY